MNLLNNKTCWILDGYGIFFQSFYGIKTNLTSNGVPVNAVYGALKTILKIINEHNPTYLFVALDTGGRTFRDDLYEKFLEKKFIKSLLDVAIEKIDKDLYHLIAEEKISPEQLALQWKIPSEKILSMVQKFSLKDVNIAILLIIYLELDDKISIIKEKSLYKANRKETPDSLKVQFPIFFELLDAIGVQKISYPGYEADDLISSIAKIFQNKDSDVIIGSSDKDLMQLINEKTTIFNFRQKTFITEVKFTKEFNFSPKELEEYLSLVGDKADNIPGVPGIGEKNATNIIRKYHTVENFLSSNIDITEMKIRDLIVKNFEIFKLSKDLVRLKNIPDLELDLEKEFKINHETLKIFSNKYNFK